MYLSLRSLIFIPEIRSFEGANILARTDLLGVRGPRPHLWSSGSLLPVLLSLAHLQAPSGPVNASSAAQAGIASTSAPAETQHAKPRVFLQM